MRRNWRMTGLLILVALVFSACQPIVAEPQAQPSDEVTAAVEAVWREYEASFGDGDIDRWVQLWLDEGVQMPPGEPPVVGKEAIRARNKAALTDPFDTSMSITNQEIHDAGEWVVARGVYEATLTPKAGGEEFLVDGKYMTLLQRQPDGSLKIYRDIFNSNVPPAPVAEAGDTETVAEAINAVWREYEASILSGDPDRWIQLWEDDGVQLPPGVPPVVGKETIYSRISDDLATFDYSEFVITNEDVEVNGDLAFARGNYVLAFAPKAGGETMDLNGKYMTIFHQQPDGSWKIYRDIFNSSG